MKRFFVYALCYPDDQQTPFYVGKGSNNRPYSHLYEAKHGHETDKALIINKIQAEGKSVVVRILFETNDEGDAIKMEKRYIRSFEQIYDLVNRMGSRIPKPDQKSIGTRWQIPRDVHRKLGAYQALFGMTSLNDAAIYILADFLDNFPFEKHIPTFEPTIKP